MATLGQHMEEELVSQPETWARAIEQARGEALAPAHGERVAVVGCGTSWFMAQSYAAARESSGLGVTDAYAASEAFLGRERGYDHVIAITRSGTTTEVIDLLGRVDLPSIAILGDTDTPVAELAGGVVALPYADEQSVVQTRFATTALAYLLTTLGGEHAAGLAAAVEQARGAVADAVEPALVEAEQFTFLGRGWTNGLAAEAALKMREAVQGWTESYPAMEYRHGPISIAAPNRVTWMLGTAPEGLAGEVERTGGTFVESGRHPLADLARVHRVTLARARARGLDPDLPRNLTRSVVLGA